LSFAVVRLILAARGFSWLLTVNRSYSMLRESLDAMPAILATRGCSHCSVGQNTSPWSRAGKSFLCARLLMTAHFCSRLLMSARGFSQLVAGSRQPCPRSLGRIITSPMPRSALRGLARGRGLLRAAGRNALPGIMCVLQAREVEIMSEHKSTGTLFTCR
jgi:hypothetical protein